LKKYDDDGVGVGVRRVGDSGKFYPALLVCIWQTWCWCERI